MKRRRRRKERGQTKWNEKLNGTERFWGVLGEDNSLETILGLGDTLVRGRGRGNENRTRERIWG